MLTGAIGSTGALCRETHTAINAGWARAILAVELEAVGRYTFSSARGAVVVCLAHVMQQLVVSEGDVDKDRADGTADVLTLLLWVA